MREEAAMFRTRPTLLTLLSALLLPLGGAQAKSGCPLDLTCIDDARQAYDQALTLADRYGSDALLVVTDVDDTLLRTDQYLGSHAWFVWQADLLRQDPTSRSLAARSFDGLLAAQELIYSLGRMHPSQPELPSLVEDLQNRGIRVIALTSRGFDLRDATHRELGRNGYDLSRNPVPPRPGFAGDDPFPPYHPGNLRAARLTPAEAARFGLGEPRPVSYRNGLYMTAGQHKGAMLRCLMARTGWSFRALVFLDDQPANVRAMANAFPPGSGVDLHALVYAREGPWERETASAKARLTASTAWQRLAATLVEVFPSRLGLPQEMAVPAGSN